MAVEGGRDETKGGRGSERWVADVDWRVAKRSQRCVWSEPLESRRAGWAAAAGRERDTDVGVGRRVKCWSGVVDVDMEEVAVIGSPSGIRWANIH